MGGQACVLYGAAEFSRDTDIAVLASQKNLELLKGALQELQATRIAVPPFEIAYLQKGHAVHFRSYHPEAERIRIDVMSVMRGVESFERLWERRVRVDFSPGEGVDLLSLADLVRSKKTQRDKDWPMIRRLVEADYLSQKEHSAEKVRFWLLESRTPRMLMELARQAQALAGELSSVRPLLVAALKGDEHALEEGLAAEQQQVREIDRAYWEPLRQELEELRRAGYPPEEPV
ncbi:MAG: hypothetical protein HRF44_03105 [Ignavibacterium sp.]|jgi:hypothetical protein